MAICPSEPIANAERPTPGETNATNEEAKITSWLGV